MILAFTVRSSLRLAALMALAALSACSDSAGVSPELGDAAMAKATARLNSLTVSVSGLPSGTPAGITVRGTGSYNATVNSTTTLSGLSNDTYTIAASNIIVSGTSYAPSPASQSTSLRNGTSRTVSVSYAAVPTTGTMNVSITGLDGAPAAVVVTGPNAYSRSLTASATLTQLVPGSYTVTASGVTSATGVIYAAAPATTTVSITAGNTATTAVTYTVTGVVPSPSFNMQIVGTTATQAVQKLDNSVVLIAGRAAMLRVFPVASASNSARPAVDVRVFINGVLQATLAATNSGTSVPTALAQTAMANSWNVIIPANLVQPGLGIQAVLDPQNTVAEGNETDNSYPASGPLALTVRAVPTLNMTFVPVAQGTAAPGDITSANVNTFLNDTRDMLPMGTVSPTIRSTYTTSRVLGSDGTNWSAVLGEVDAVRTADRSSAHYYGVIKPTYGGGVAGIGYIGWPVSLGWDPLWSASNVMAHELGHNFGRRHAPCGGPGSPDASYPYSGGQIGVFGFNVRTGTLFQNTTPDLMGYCDPNWISDYTFNAIMNYRGFSAAALLAAGTTAEQPSLLVWGRVEPDGSLVLEPAVRMTARSVLPSVGGDYAITAYDASGNALFSVDFTPKPTSNDGVDGGAHFSFMVPMSDAAYAQLSRLALQGNGRTAERISRQLPAAAQAAAQAAARGLDIAADAAARTRLKWNTAAFPLIMVRDPLSGEVLSFARNGDASVLTGRSELEVFVSDGVRSEQAVVKVRGR